MHSFTGKPLQLATVKKPKFCLKIHQLMPKEKYANPKEGLCQ